MNCPDPSTGGYGFVTSPNPKITQDLVISRENAGNAKPGDIVSAEIIAYPLRGRPPEGRIIRVIGRPGQPGIDSELIIEQYELPVAVLTCHAPRGRRDPAAGHCRHAQGQA